MNIPTVPQRQTSPLFHTQLPRILFIRLRLWTSNPPLESAKLPRSHSSPSPPLSKQPAGRSDSRKNGQNGHRFRRRQGSAVADVSSRPHVDWSTSYHAGSSRCVGNISIRHLFDFVFATAQDQDTAQMMNLTTNSRLALTFVDERTPRRN